MVDTVNTSVVFNGNRRFVGHYTNESDGTGESAVTKLDISTLTDAHGVTATKTIVDLIEYAVTGFNYVTVEWDRTGENDEIAVLSGSGVIDWAAYGGKVDPGSTATGDIVFTTDGAADGDSYDITIHLRPKA